MFGLNGKRSEDATAEEQTFTFLARGFEFKGLLTFDGTARIDGTVHGQIHTNGTLIMGEHAVIEGDVRAGTIVSGGTINGNVMAAEKVHLLSSASLLGDVKTPLLRIEEGVRFYGTCEAEGCAGGQDAAEVRETIPQTGKLRLPDRGEAL